MQCDCSHRERGAKAPEEAGEGKGCRLETDRIRSVLKMLKLLCGKWIEKSKCGCWQNSQEKSQRAMLRSLDSGARDWWRQEVTSQGSEGK